MIVIMLDDDKSLGGCLNSCILHMDCFLHNTLVRQDSVWRIGG